MSDDNLAPMVRKAASFSRGEVVYISRRPELSTTPRANNIIMKIVSGE